jgi:hypothetical protein
MTQKTYKLVRQVILGNTTSDKIGSWQIEKQSTNDLLLREKPKKKWERKKNPMFFAPNSSGLRSAVGTDYTIHTQKLQAAAATASYLKFIYKYVACSTCVV